MKTGKTWSFVGITVLFIVVVLSNGCGDKAGDPFATANFNPYDQELGKRIETYHNTTAPDNANLKTGNPALYIDFSSGIYKAFAQPQIKSMMVDCFNTILAQKFDVYKLGSGKITPLNVSNTTQLGQQVSNPTEYADIFAPIQSAVEKIVDSNNDALLITDFEEWQNNTEVTTTAFLKIPFSKWIGKGNTIHFFIVDYKEGTVEKHLYFTIFNCGSPNASSMISRLASKLGGQSVTRFDLSDRAYKLWTAYPTERSGGIFYDPRGKSDKAKNILDLKNDYVKGDYFEFYPLGLDWASIDKLHATYKSQSQFNDFFRNLFIDLSDDDSYIFGDLSVKVSDATTDFENFAKAEEAKKHRPKLAKGSDGEAKLADNETDPIALACYNTDGKLKEQWIYKPQATGAIDGVFKLNENLFKNTKASGNKNVELGVSFDPQFNLKNIQNPNGLLKVDILLNTAAPNLANAKLDKFQWKNAKKVANVALYESVKNTLQDLKPTNKVIYSYYIKTQQ